MRALGWGHDSLPRIARGEGSPLYDTAARRLTAVFPIKWSAYAHSTRCAERFFKGGLASDACEGVGASRPALISPVRFTVKHEWGRPQRWTKNI